MKKNFFLDLELSLADAVLLGTNVRILSKRLDFCTEDLQKGGEDSWSVLEAAFQNEFHNKRVLRLVASKVVLTDNQRLRMMVCLGKKWDEIKPLLPDDVDFQNNESGSTLLMDAARFGQVNVARRLIEAGADVNARDFNGWTALQHGAHDWKTVRMLVENGADINTTDNDGDMFLEDLANNRHPVRFIRFALKNGADPNVLFYHIMLLHKQYPFAIWKALLKKGIRQSLINFAYEGTFDISHNVAKNVVDLLKSYATPCDEVYNGFPYWKDRFFI